MDVFQLLNSTKQANETLPSSDFSAEEIKNFTHAFAYKANRAQRPTNDLVDRHGACFYHKKTRAGVFEVAKRTRNPDPRSVVYCDSREVSGNTIKYARF